MSDVTIPESVRKIGEALSLKYGDELWTSELSNEIARAILAERERCADLADVLPLTELVRTNDEDPKIIWRVAATTQRDAIAQAIRSSQEGSTT